MQHVPETAQIFHIVMKLVNNCYHHLATRGRIIHMVSHGFGSLDETGFVSLVIDDVKPAS